MLLNGFFHRTYCRTWFIQSPGTECATSRCITYANNNPLLTYHVYHRVKYRQNEIISPNTSHHIHLASFHIISQTIARVGQNKPLLGHYLSIGFDVLMQHSMGIHWHRNTRTCAYVEYIWLCVCMVWMHGPNGGRLGGYMHGFIRHGIIFDMAYIFMS